MNKQTKVERFHQIVKEMANLYEKKNDNYGDSFGKLYSDLGPVAGLVPLHNKLDRITNLVKGGANNFESLEDSFKDLACYAIMNLIEMEAKENEKNQEVERDITINDNSQLTIDIDYNTEIPDCFGTKTVLLNNIVEPNNKIKTYVVNGKKTPKENK